LSRSFPAWVVALALRDGAELLELVERVGAEVAAEQQLGDRSIPSAARAAALPRRSA
jgi:hypothetical protein